MPGNIKTPLLPHQLRLADKVQASGGVLAHWDTGSGKSLGSLHAIDEAGLPADVVVPAPLVANYEKEIAKHMATPPENIRIRSYEKAVRDGIDPNRTVVFDEAQRGRNTGTEANRLLREAQNAPRRLILSATPLYNQAHDLAPLLNAAAGRNVLPTDPAQFKNEYIRDKLIEPTLFQRLRGAKGGFVQELKNKNRLVNAATGYVDVHDRGEENYPRRVEETVNVPMSSKQHQIYRYHEGTLPTLLRLKVRFGLPLDKAEAKQLNAFGTALRQTANTPRPYVDSLTDADELEHAPKIRRAVEEMLKRKEADPNFRGIVYSNYLDAGVHPYARALAERGVPHAIFTGDVPKEIRDRHVRDYNEGRTPVMLLSGAGSEGLDLKGTKLIQLLDPHFNESRLKQVEGRGIRYMSHAHLPEAEREVLVQRYMATHPESLLNRIGIGKPDMAIDQYLHQTSQRKEQLAQQIRAALQEASARGPLRKAASARTFDTVEEYADYCEKLAQLISDEGYYHLTGGMGAVAGALSDRRHRLRNAIFSAAVTPFTLQHGAQLGGRLGEKMAPVGQRSSPTELAGAALGGTLGLLAPALALRYGQRLYDRHQEPLEPLEPQEKTAVSSAWIAQHTAAGLFSQPMQARRGGRDAIFDRHAAAVQGMSDRLDQGGLSDAAQLSLRARIAKRRIPTLMLQTGQGVSDQPPPMPPPTASAPPPPPPTMPPPTASAPPPSQGPTGMSAPPPSPGTPPRASMNPAALAMMGLYAGSAAYGGYQLAKRIRNRNIVLGDAPEKRAAFDRTKNLTAPRYAVKDRGPTKKAPEIRPLAQRLKQAMSAETTGALLGGSVGALGAGLAHRVDQPQASLKDRLRRTALGGMAGAAAGAGIGALGHRAGYDEAASNIADAFARRFGGR